MHKLLLKSCVDRVHIVRTTIGQAVENRLVCTQVVFTPQALGTIPRFVRSLSELLSQVYTHAMLGFNSVVFCFVHSIPSPNNGYNEGE